MCVPTPIIVAVIDDDDSIRVALGRLLKAAGIEPIGFSSAAQFLSDPRNLAVECAVVDVRLPGVDGLTLQEELAHTLPHLSLVFISGHGDIPMTVNAMKKGAIDFLEKPVDGEVLLGAIRRATERTRKLKESHDKLDDLEQRFRRLTPRERQVFAMVTVGRLNKQIAFDLGISEKTVKVHRARVMEKMDAGSFADLVRMAQSLNPQELPGPV
jgi:FixJ family two-component response regulator